MMVPNHEQDLLTYSAPAAALVQEIEAKLIIKRLLLILISPKILHTTPKLHSEGCTQSAPTTMAELALKMPQSGKVGLTALEFLLESREVSPWTD
jgi:hypothetical protein